MLHALRLWPLSGQALGLSRSPQTELIQHRSHRPICTGRWPAGLGRFLDMRRTPEHLLPSRRVMAMATAAGVFCISASAASSLKPGGDGTMPKTRMSAHQQNSFCRGIAPALRRPARALPDHSPSVSCSCALLPATRMAGLGSTPPRAIPSRCPVPPGHDASPPGCRPA